MDIFIDSKTAHQLNDTIFVDCTHLITEPDEGKTKYEEEHIPNARFAHLDNILSGELTGNNGRHPLPKLNKFHNWLENNAITPDKIIICYDNLNGGIAARLWWMLYQIGFTRVHIMLDGIEGWKGNGYPTQTKVPVFESISFELNLTSWDEGPYEIKKLVDIKEGLNKIKLIDSRSPERHNGETEPYDEIAGTIPSSINLFWGMHLENNRLKNDIKTGISSILDITGLNQYTVYCGSGVTAAFNLAIFEQLNLPKPAYFPGSYSEWCQNYPENIEIKKP